MSWLIEEKEEQARSGGLANWTSDQQSRTSGVLGSRTLAAGNEDEEVERFQVSCDVSLAAVQDEAELTLARGYGMILRRA